LIIRIVMLIGRNLLLSNLSVLSVGLIQPSMYSIATKTKDSKLYPILKIPNTNSKTILTTKPVYYRIKV